MVRSHAYAGFVIASAMQLAALWLIGQSRFSTIWLIVTWAAIALLGRRSRLAWWFLILTNAWAVLSSLALAASSGGVTTSWGNVIALALGSAIALVLLTSRSMRRDMRSRTSRRA